MDAHKVIEAIAAEKDVTVWPATATPACCMTGQPAVPPLDGVMKIWNPKAWLRGAEAVIVGASIVGKPMAMLLLQAGATITICNSKTRDLAAQTPAPTCWSWRPASRA